MGIELLLDMAVVGHGERIAVGPLEGGLTFEKLQQLARGVATVITERGATHLATVAVIGPLLPLSIFGAALAGVPTVPLNYRLSRNALEELLCTLDRPLVVADAEYATMLAKPGRILLTTDELFAAAQAAQAIDPVFADDESPAVILFTSGTTSKPKGVVLTHANLSSYVMGTVDFGSARPEECQLICVPPYHVAGVGSALTSTFSGRRVLHVAQFTAEAWLSAVRDEGVTVAMVVPTMLARVVEHLDGAAGNVPSLRSLAYGGARMPRPVLEKALAAFPDVDFVNAYGLTETSSTISVLGPQDHRAAMASEDPVVRNRLSSAGQPVPGIEIEIRDEAGVPLGPGEVGEIVVRGPQVSGSYVGLGSALDAAGWFPTKDRGWQDADGYLFIEGRSDDTIIRGGENIAPAEIEDALIQHDAVRECAVVGVPDDDWGERLAAAVVVEPGREVSSDEVRTFVRSRLRGSRTPDDVYFLTELPYTPTGKLLRRELLANIALQTQRA